MVLAYSSGNVADTGKPGLTSQQTRVFNSRDSEVARVSSAVSQNVEASRVESPRAIEASAETQKPRTLPPQIQAELNRSRDISFTQDKPERSVENLVKNLDQQKVQDQRAVEKAERPDPAQLEREARAREPKERERSSSAESSAPQRDNTVRLQAQKAYLDRIDAQRAYRKAADREDQVRVERARAAA